MVPTCERVFGITDLNVSHNDYGNYINTVFCTANGLIYTTLREVVLLPSSVAILHTLLTIPYTKVSVGS